MLFSSSRRHLVVGEWEAGEGGREEARGRVSQWFTEEVGTAWTGVTAGSGGTGTDSGDT